MFRRAASFVVLALLVAAALRPTFDGPAHAADKVEMGWLPATDVEKI